MRRQSAKLLTIAAICFVWLLVFLTFLTWGIAETFRWPLARLCEGLRWLASLLVNTIEKLRGRA